MATAPGAMLTRYRNPILSFQTTHQPPNNPSAVLETAMPGGRILNAAFRDRRDAYRDVSLCDGVKSLAMIDEALRNPSSAAKQTTAATPSVGKMERAIAELEARLTPAERLEYY